MLPSEPKLYTSDQVPEHFRESFIFSGYRSPCSSSIQCVLSIFQLTNETLNIWTHLIPAVYFGWTVVAFWQSLDAAALPYMAPLVVYMATVCMFPLASMLAHVFNAMSVKARHVCFFVDYWALSLYGFGSAFAFRAYSFTRSQLDSPYVDAYLPVAAFVSSGSLLVSCRTRLMKRGWRRKVVRFASFAIPYFFNVMPLLYRLAVEDDAGKISREADYFHARQFVFAFLSAFLYCSHIPERLFPGRFDIIGHSHQLFHVVSAIGSHDALLAIIQDSAAGQPPSSLSLSVHLLLTAVVLVVNSVVVLYYVNYLDYTYRPPAVGSTSGSYKTDDSCTDENHEN